MTKAIAKFYAKSARPANWPKDGFFPPKTTHDLPIGHIDPKVEKELKENEKLTHHQRMQIDLDSSLIFDGRALFKTPPHIIETLKVAKVSEPIGRDKKIIEPPFAGINLAPPYYEAEIFTLPMDGSSPDSRLVDIWPANPIDLPFSVIYIASEFNATTSSNGEIEPIDHWKGRRLDILEAFQRQSGTKFPKAPAMQKYGHSFKAAKDIAQALREEKTQDRRHIIRTQNRIGVETDAVQELMQSLGMIAETRDYRMQSSIEELRKVLVRFLHSHGDEPAEKEPGDIFAFSTDEIVEGLVKAAGKEPEIGGKVAAALNNVMTSKQLAELSNGLDGEKIAVTEDDDDVEEFLIAAEKAAKNVSKLNAKKKS